MLKINSLAIITVLLIPSILSAQTNDGELQRVMIGDAEIEYSVQGSGEPVLFIDGSAITNTFQFLMSEPALDDYQLITYHRRGYLGSSFPDSAFSIEDQASDAKGLLAHLNINKAHVVGHSYGGVIAFQLSLDDPELVHSLVVVEPSILIGPPPAELIAAIEGYATTGDAVTSINNFITWVVGEDWAEGCNQIIPGCSDQVTQDAKTFFEIEVPALNQWQFSEEVAENIAQPVLLMIGTESVPALTASEPFLQSWIPQLEIQKVNGANHSLSSHDPQEFSTTISDFLNKNSF